jgi:hypothetical protein
MVRYFNSMSERIPMPWYEIGIDPKRAPDGKDTLIRMIQRSWELSGKPQGFALLGTHKTPDERFDVYYLTPACQDPINEHSGGFFTFWQVVPTNKKPVRAFLGVLVGDLNALALLD